MTADLTECPCCHQHLGEGHPHASWCSDEHMRSFNIRIGKMRGRQLSPEEAAEVSQELGVLEGEK